LNVTIESTKDIQMHSLICSKKIAVFEEMNE